MWASDKGLLGTGCGFSSIVLGALLSRAASTGPALQIDNGRVAVARLHATDLESAVPLIERNIRSNIHLFCDRVQSGPNPDQFRAAGTDDAEGAGLELESSSTTQPHLKPRSIQISAGVLDWEDDRLPQEVQDAPPNVIMWVSLLIIFGACPLWDQLTRSPMSLG